MSSLRPADLLRHMNGAFFVEFAFQAALTIFRKLLIYRLNLRATTPGMALAVSGVAKNQRVSSHSRKISNRRI